MERSGGAATDATRHMYRTDAAVGLIWRNKRNGALRNA